MCTALLLCVLLQVEDTYGVLNTLALRTIRKKTFLTLIKMFERAEHETGDKECVHTQTALHARGLSHVTHRTAMRLSDRCVCYCCACAACCCLHSLTAAVCNCCLLPPVLQVLH